MSRSRFDNIFSRLSVAASMAGSLVSLLMISSGAQAITCSQIIGSDGEPLYTVETTLAPIVNGTAPVLIETQMRAAVAMMHPETYREDMSLQELDRLGEGLTMSIWRIPLIDDTVRVINVGYGAGSVAHYLFPVDAPEFESAAIIDQRCVEPGESPYFPIGEIAPATMPASMTCTIASGEAPFSSIQFEVQVADSLAGPIMVGDSVRMTARWSDAYEYGAGADDFSSESIFDALRVDSPKQADKTERTERTEKAEIWNLGFQISARDTRGWRISAWGEWQEDTVILETSIYERYLDDKAPVSVATFSCDPAPFTAVRFYQTR